MFCLWAWKGFREGIGCHVVGRTVNELERSIVNDEANEMVVYVDVLGVSMIVAIGGDGDG